jgi:hypothetical protein
VTIGKPAVNHHYKPKVRKLEMIDPARNFLRAKKHNSSKGKAYKVQPDKQAISKK